MSNWFGTKAEQGVVYASPRNSLDKHQKRLPYSTPHDAILADLHASPDRVASPESTDVNLVTPTQSLHPYQPSRLSSPDLLLDPFNGTSLGTLLPHSQDSEVLSDHHSMPSLVNLPSPEIGRDANMTIPSELVWSHLTNIMDLQSQISKKHLEMESIGHVDVKGKKHAFTHKPTLSNASPTGIGSGAKRTVSENLSSPGSSTRERALSTASTISSSDGDPAGDEANVDVPSEEAEKNRAREEEFASLAHQFEGRKEAINDIMGKVCKLSSFSKPCFIQRSISQLDDLFNVLSEFHSLQAPNLDFPSSHHQSSASPSK